MAKGKKIISKKPQKKKPTAQNPVQKPINFKTEYIHISLLVLIFLASFSYIFNPNLDLNGDNFNYLILGKSIAAGNGYTSPMTPSLRPASHFPPGYSALLALELSIFGENVKMLKIFNGLLLLFSSMILYKIVNKISKSTALAFAISTLLLLNQGVLYYATAVMSEIPFMFYCVVALIAFYKSADHLVFYKDKYFYLLIASSVAAYFTRSIGITLLGTVTLAFLLSKNWKAAVAYLGGFILLYLPWIIRNNSYNIKGRYLGTVMTVNPWRPEQGEIESVGLFLEKMILNFNDTVIKGFQEIVFPFITYPNPGLTPTIIAIGILVFLVVLWGAWNSGKLRYFISLFILSNIFIFMVWHGGNGSRYVWPLAPFVLFAFYNGVFDLIKRLVKNPLIISRLPYAFILFGLLGFSHLSTLNTRAKGYYPPNYQNYFALAQDLKKEGQKDIIVIARKPAMFHYYSGTFTSNYKYTLDNKELIADLVKKKADYVVLDQLGYSSTGRYLNPAIQNNLDLFKIANQKENPTTYLLKFDIEAAIRKFGLTTD